MGRREISHFAIATALAATLVGGCAAHVAPVPTDIDARLPSFVVSTGLTEVSADADGRNRVARLQKRGLPVEVVEQHRGVATVIVRGGIEVTGFVAAHKLGVVVCEGGALSEDFYAGAGNVLGFRTRLPDGKIEVVGMVPLRGSALRFVGTIDERRLCTAPPKPRHAGTAEDPQVLHIWNNIDEEDFPRGTAIVAIEANEILSLRDRPDGKVVHTQPADRFGYPAARIRQEGSWDLIAVGGGPYMLGWIPTRAIQRATGDPMKGGIMGTDLVSSTSTTPTALSSHTISRFALHVLPADAAIEVSGAVRARLTKPGFARLLEEKDDRFHVTAAVDNDLTVEGWLPRPMLGPAITP